MKSLKLCVFALIALFMLTACSSSETVMEFSFNTSTVVDSSKDSKTIYINNDMDELELDAKLTVDSGDVTISISDISNGDIVWSGNYTSDASFTIKLDDVRQDSEYLLEIQALKSKKVKLTVTTETKLVRDKEKPEKPVKYYVG